MKSLDPRVKLFAVTAATSLALLFKDCGRMLLLCLFTLCMAFLLGADLFSFFKRLRHFLVLLLGIAVMQILFIRSGTAIIIIHDFVLVTQDGIMSAMMTGMRFFVILCSASIMAFESSRRVIRGLVQMRIPYLFCFMVSIALRFLPVFSQGYTDALVSLQLRGIELKKVPYSKRIYVYGSLLLPVIADAIVKSQDLAVAMEARGFGAMKSRTSYIELKMRRLDWAALWVLILAVSLAVYRL